VPRRITSFLTGLATASLCLIGVAWLASSERAAREQDLTNETQVVAYQFSKRLRSTLEKHVVALQQMANFFENSDEVTEVEFYSFAAETLKQIPVCLRISRLDPSLHIRTIYPPGPNEALVGTDTRISPIGHTAVVRAMESRDPVFSPPMPLLDSGRGFILAVPIYRHGRFEGEVAGTLRGTDFLASFNVPAVTARYEEIILGSGKSLLPGPEVPPEPAHDRTTMATGFSLAGVEWEVRVTPRQEVVNDRLRSGRSGFWTIGILLALLAGTCGGAAVHYGSSLAQRVRTQDEALRKAHQTLDGARMQLIQAEKLTAIGELVAGVAHELNNPLAAVLGYVQLLLARDLPVEVRRRLETVCTEAERMARIVKNLLTFARKHPPEKRYLGLNGIIEKTLELKAYHFRVNHIEVETELDPALPMSMLDFHQVQQVVINLLNNAEQAMGEKGKNGRLKIQTRAVAGRLEARFTDTGPGIAPDAQTHIFEPFFTTKKEGKGTGLGLSMCYGIMQEHGGCIRFESQPGRGATFILEFPIAARPDATATPAADTTAGKRHLSILVVDDEQTVSDFMVDLLTSRGHRVNTASDVPEALLKIARDELDLIISDMHMPHGSGQDIYRAVLANKPLLAQRIVFMTGSGTTQETQRFLRETGIEIIAKPCSIGEIERAIERATGQPARPVSPSSALG
jgi:signal transduction histidine kinase/ActR/RegA family two-component response regulator